MIESATWMGWAGRLGERGTPLRNRSRSRGARPNKHSRDYYKVRTDLDLDDILESTENPLLLILDGVQDPHNLGACLRTADGAGVDAVIAPQRRAAGLTETVSRIACGAAESVPFIQVSNIATTIRKLRELAILVVGTAVTPEAKSLYEVDLTIPVAFVLGSEGSGARALTQRSCDVIAYVPMKGKVDCLNVSVSAGVCLYEAVRQRDLGSGA